MTSDPFQLFMIILLIAGFPFMAWAPGRITELVAAGEEERVPDALKRLADKRYIETVHRRERTSGENYRRKIFVAVIGLVLPLITLCSATAESFMPWLMVVLASAIVFFIGVALLEWLIRPRSQIPDK